MRRLSVTFLTLLVALTFSIPTVVIANPGDWCIPDRNNVSVNPIDRIRRIGQAGGSVEFVAISAVTDDGPPGGTIDFVPYVQSPDTSFIYLELIDSSGQGRARAGIRMHSNGTWSKYMTLTTSGGASIVNYVGPQFSSAPENINLLIWHDNDGLPPSYHMSVEGFEQVGGFQFAWEDWEADIAQLVFRTRNLNSQFFGGGGHYYRVEQLRYTSQYGSSDWYGTFLTGGDPWSWPRHTGDIGWSGAYDFDC